MRVAGIDLGKSSLSFVLATVDGDGGTSATHDATVNVAAQNDVPTISKNETIRVSEIINKIREWFFFCLFDRGEIDTEHCLKNPFSEPLISTLIGVSTSTTSSVAPMPAASTSAPVATTSRPTAG